MKIDNHPVLPVHSPSTSRQPSPEYTPDLPISQSRSHPSRSSASSFESRADLTTAVNTPFGHSPSCSKKDLGILSEDGTVIQEKDSCGDSGIDEIVKEKRVRRKIEKEGKTDHTPPGVKEGKVAVDLGNGLEEVIMVDWLPNDPEV